MSSAGRPREKRARVAIGLPPASTPARQRWSLAETALLQQALLQVGLHLRRLYKFLLDNGVTRFEKEQVRNKIKTKGFRAWIASHVHELPNLSDELRRKIRESMGETGLEEVANRSRGDGDADNLDDSGDDDFDDDVSAVEDMNDDDFDDLTVPLSSSSVPAVNDEDDLTEMFTDSVGTSRALKVLGLKR